LESLVVLAVVVQEMVRELEGRQRRTFTPLGLVMEI
jgi:hypothetical protein